MTEMNVYQRTIRKETIASSELGKPRSAIVYLPPGYNQLVAYPVIYCQDGMEFFNFGRIATHANRLILEEGMEPVVIVGAEVDLPNRSSEYAPEGSRFAAYCRFFTEELVPYIEEQYAVRRDPANRILAGESLGATVSLHLSLDRPDLFRNVIALSGAFFESTRKRLEPEGNLAWLELYMLVGLQEREVKTEWGAVDFLMHNRETKRLLEERQARLRYKETDGKHIWGFWQNELLQAMRHFIRA